MFGLGILLNMFLRRKPILPKNIMHPGFITKFPKVNGQMSIVISLNGKSVMPNAAPQIV